MPKVRRDLLTAATLQQPYVASIQSGALKLSIVEERQKEKRRSTNREAEASLFLEIYNCAKDIFCAIKVRGFWA